jgi:hypothetical protein
MKFISGWANDNPRLARFTVAWALFILFLSLSTRLGDFSIASPQDPPVVIYFVSALRVMVLAALSIFNVYWAIPFLKALGKDPASRRAQGTLFGFFGCFGCALASITTGLGLATALFTALTGAHILFWMSKRKFKKLQ